MSLLYHERCEERVSIDEAKTHLRSKPNLRSESPQGVVQDVDCDPRDSQVSFRGGATSRYIAAIDIVYGHAPGVANSLAGIASLASVVQ